MSLDQSTRIPGASIWTVSPGYGLSIQCRQFGDSILSLVTMPRGILTVDHGIGQPLQDAEFRLSISLSGGIGECAGKIFRLRRGDMMLFDGALPSRVLADHPSSWLTLSFPRHVIARRFSGAPSIPPFVIPRTGIMASLFRSSLFALWRTGSGLVPQLTTEMAETQIDLMMDAIRDILNPSQDAELHHAAMRVRVSDVIRSGLHDSDFDAATLAVRMGLSPKELARLLNNITPTYLIRQLRLAEARRLLRSGVLARLSIAEIAHRVGFGNLTHFSALYGETFGSMPKHDRAR